MNSTTKGLKGQVKKLTREDDQEGIFFPTTHNTINSVKNISSAQDLHLQKKIKS